MSQNYEEKEDDVRLAEDDDDNTLWDKGVEGDNNMKPMRNDIDFRRSWVGAKYWRKEGGELEPILSCLKQIRLDICQEMVQKWGSGFSLLENIVKNFRSTVIYLSVAMEGKVRGKENFTK